jgi:hypothetical protein
MRPRIVQFGGLEKEEAEDPESSCASSGSENKANLYGSATTEADETIETGGGTEEFTK